MLGKVEFTDDISRELSTLLLEAIRGDSNLEMEWLWFASRMTEIFEREYCLKRALYINPCNHATQYELHQITKCRRRAISPEHTTGGRYNWARRKILERLRHMMQQTIGQFVRLFKRRDPVRSRDLHDGSSITPILYAKADQYIDGKNTLQANAEATPIENR